MNSIKDALSHGLQQLQDYSDSAQIDAEILLTHCLNNTRTYLYTHPEYSVKEEELRCYLNLIAKRQKGSPIAYLTGQREFWSLPLKISSATLIPRPETELLVEICLQQVNAPVAFVLDLGTGSGAIALALAKERPHWQLQAIDYCEEALKIAQENAKKFNLPTIKFLHSFWFEQLAPNTHFDIIAANPPYIAVNDPHLLQGDVRFEPQKALVAENNGLSDLHHIIKEGYHYLKTDGWLLLEHGYDQKNAVQSMFEKFGYHNITSWKDWQGNDRVSGAQRRC